MRKQALYQVTILENPWIPDEIKVGITPRQAEFLTYEGREGLYGGAAGGGKSVALLAAALQYVMEPRYSSLILRRTYKQLAKADSILSKAKEWLIGRRDEYGRKAKWNGDDHKFTFPTGSTLEFGHMDHEDSKHDYQGGAWPFVGVDECTQFTDTMLAYPRTRQRRVINSMIPVRWRGGTNPGGIGHDHIKARYVKRADGSSPQTPGRQFFPATLDDNPHIDREDYIKQLKESGIDANTLKQLLAGDWDAVGGGRFWPAWFTQRYTQRGDYLILLRAGENPQTAFHFRWQECDRFMTVDPAASAKTTADWTVAGVWLRTKRNELLLMDAIRFQAEIPDICDKLEALSLKWGCSGVWIEAVAANNGVYALAKRTRMPARSLNPMGLDKLVRATPAMNLAAEGRVWLPAPGVRPSCPLEDLEAEWYRFTGDEKQDANDDAVDMLSYAAKVLISGPSAQASRAVPMIIGGR